MFTTVTLVAAVLAKVKSTEATVLPVPVVLKYVPQKPLGDTREIVGSFESTHTSDVAEPLARLVSVTVTCSSVAAVK